MDLITGGTGFLGSHLAAQLLIAGREIRIFKRKTSKFDEIKMILHYYFGNDYENQFKKINFVEGEITNPFDIEKAIENVENVYHCSAMVSFDSRDKEKLFDTNIEGTETLINVLSNNNIKKLCHVSSIASLGRSKNETATDENTMWENTNNNTLYSQSKHESEKIVWRAIAEGLNAVIVQPGIMLGIGNWNKGTCKLFELVDKGLRFYTKGVNGYVDVKDVATIMKKLVDSDLHSERYILVSENISYQYILNEMGKGLNKKQPDIYAGYYLRKAVVSADTIFSFLTRKSRLYSKDFARLAAQTTLYDSQKIISALNYEFNTISNCISDTCEYYLKVK